MGHLYTWYPQQETRLVYAVAWRSKKVMLGTEPLVVRKEFDSRNTRDRYALWLQSHEYEIICRSTYWIRVDTGKKVPNPASEVSPGMHPYVKPLPKNEEFVF